MIALLILIILFIAIYFLLIGFPDSTDKSFFKRSGMRLYIDYETGNHYLSGPFGGPLIPRLDRNGDQINSKGIEG